MAKRIRVYTDEQKANNRRTHRAWCEKNREKRRATNRKWYRKYAQREIAKQRERYLTNPEVKARIEKSRKKRKLRTKVTARIAALDRNYKLSTKAYFLLLKRQDFRCAICRTDSPKDSVLYDPITWSVDHNHFTGENRGLLCVKCNLLLGMVDERTEVLQAAISYLERHAKITKTEQFRYGNILDLPRKV